MSADSLSPCCRHCSPSLLPRQNNDSLEPWEKKSHHTFTTLHTRTPAYKALLLPKNPLIRSQLWICIKWLQQAQHLRGAMCQLPSCEGVSWISGWEYITSCNTMLEENKGKEKKNAKLEHVCGWLALKRGRVAAGRELKIPITNEIIICLDL